MNRYFEYLDQVNDLNKKIMLVESPECTLNYLEKTQQINMYKKAINVLSDCYMARMIPS